MTDRSIHHDGGDGMSPADSEFARQLAVPLRAAEPLSPDFDARVMAAVMRERAAVRSSALVPIWRRRRTLTLAPFTWAALAAGFAGIVSLATLSVARAHVSVTGSSAAPPVHLAAVSPMTDTVYVVRFVLADSHAHTVTLLGDFNAWAKHATPLTPAAKPGVWTAQVALTPGRHEYAFLVDGKRWIADPAAEHHADEFGTQSSVVMVGDAGVSE